MRPNLPRFLLILIPQRYLRIPRQRIGVPSQLNGVPMRRNQLISDSRIINLWLILILVIIIVIARHEYSWPGVDSSRGEDLALAGGWGL